MYLVSNIEYPATQYEPALPEMNGVYHEDREVNLTAAVGVSQMYRTYNAKFVPASNVWVQSDTTLPAYATVQDNYGSIHYYTLNTTSGLWEGSDNNTIYNAVDFALTPGVSASPADNTIALANLFVAMATAVSPFGGFGRIPQYNFPVNASPSTLPLELPMQSVFEALGAGGYNNGDGTYHFSINDPPDTSDASVFLTASYGSSTKSSGGTVLRNIAFQWVEPGYDLDTCLSFNTWNDIADRCNFTDCPVAIYFGGLAGVAVHCTVNYGAVDSDPPLKATAFYINGNQNAILGPSELGGGALGTEEAPSKSTCIGIGGGVATVEHNTIRACHIYDWNYGIDYSDINGTGYGSGTTNDVIDGNKIDCIKTCINLVPAGPNGQIFNQMIVNNEMTKTKNSTDGSPIVYIDANEGGAPNIGPILLVDNVIFSDWRGPDFVDTLIGFSRRLSRKVIHGKAPSEVLARVQA